MSNLTTLIAQPDAPDTAGPALRAERVGEGDFWITFADQADVIKDQACQHVTMWVGAFQAWLQHQWLASP
jgi:hypothetical protein